ncbi:glycosyltransferase family 4 protein [Candidatus Acidulodesulfobacterium sp. H_13]|uniref:glycosyltransferase family 4 protein n=1 Tax=Candidatus Acidulodesulfobacterium sp. H_13 TaxID=3395470 RepID=UPI003AF6BEF9
MDKRGKFNILHIDSFREFGGAQSDIVMLLKFMKLFYGEKFNIYVIHNGNKKLRNELDGLGIYSLSIEMKNFLDIKAVLKIRNFLKKYDIDLINFHSSRDQFLGGIASILVYKKKIVKILTRHVAYKVNFFKGALIYRYLTDNFIAISDFIKNGLISDLKIDPEKIETIYSPRVYDADELERDMLFYKSETESVRHELGIKPDEKIISLIGRLSKEKGHEVFIKAAELIIKTRKDLKFVIIGEGELHSLIADSIDIKGLRDYFIIVGFKKDIKRYIFASDLIIVPSSIEGMGSIIVEACALKKAVVASNVGGIPEVIKNNETGFLFEAGNCNELANKIIFCIDKRELIKRIGLNCHNEVILKFDAKEIASRTASVYLNLLTN